jgi:hypothetical protein
MGKLLTPIAMAGDTKQCDHWILFTLGTTMSALLYMSAIYVYYYVYLFAPIAVFEFALSKLYFFLSICRIISSNRSYIVKLPQDKVLKHGCTMHFSYRSPNPDGGPWR